MKYCLAFVLLGVVVAAQTPDRRDLVKGSVPTVAEMQKIFADENAISRLVDCLVAHRFDEVGCDSRLKKPYYLAGDYLSNPRSRGRSCLPNCTVQEDQSVRIFLEEFKRRDRRRYNQLVLGILERVNSPDYSL